MVGNSKDGMLPGSLAFIDLLEKNENITTMPAMYEGAYGIINLGEASFKYSSEIHYFGRNKKYICNVETPLQSREQQGELEKLILKKHPEFTQIEFHSN